VKRIVEPEPQNLYPLIHQHSPFFNFFNTRFLSNNYSSLLTLNSIIHFKSTPLNKNVFLPCKQVPCDSPLQIQWRQGIQYIHATAADVHQGNAKTLTTDEKKITIAISYIEGGEASIWANGFLDEKLATKDFRK